MPKRPSTRRAEVKQLADRIKLASGRGRAPAIAELVEIACREWGGAEQFIQFLIAEIRHSDEGSVARQRGLSALLEMFKTAAKQQEDARQPDELLSDDDLRAEFYELTGFNPADFDPDGQEKEPSPSTAEAAHATG